MPKTVNKTVSHLLVNVRNHNLPAEVIYTFADDTTQVNPINNEVFYNERGNYTSPQEIFDLFSDTMHDRRAVDFYIHT